MNDYKSIEKLNIEDISQGIEWVSTGKHSKIGYFENMFLFTACVSRLSKDYGNGYKALIVFDNQKNRHLNNQVKLIHDMIELNTDEELSYAFNVEFKLDSFISNFYEKYEIDENKYPCKPVEINVKEKCDPIKYLSKPIICLFLVDSVSLKTMTFKHQGNLLNFSFNAQMIGNIGEFDEKVIRKNIVPFSFKIDGIEEKEMILGEDINQWI